MNIPDEAVEAAARALFESESYLNKWDWPVPEVDRDEYRKHARAALEAAAPHLGRTITTAAERVTVKPGAIGVDMAGNAWKRGTGSWVSTGGDTPPLYDDMDYTLTILREGGTK